MKRPLSQAAFDSYVADPEGAAYLASDILKKRLHQLLRLIADGEKFTVCEAADFVFLPSEVFKFVRAEALATETKWRSKPYRGRRHSPSPTPIKFTWIAAPLPPS